MTSRVRPVRAIIVAFAAFALLLSALLAVVAMRSGPERFALAWLLPGPRILWVGKCQEWTYVRYKYDYASWIDHNQSTVVAHANQPSRWEYFYPTFRRHPVKALSDFRWAGWELSQYNGGAGLSYEHYLFWLGPSALSVYSDFNVGSRTLEVVVYLPIWWVVLLFVVPGFIVLLGLSWRRVMPRLRRGFPVLHREVTPSFPPASGSI